MTSKIRKASTLKITIFASICWVAIILQIKIDSRRGRLFFKCLRALLGILSIFAAIGTTSMLAYKIHKSVT
jgi:hypothetical protein